VSTTNPIANVWVIRTAVNWWSSTAITSASAATARYVTVSITSPWPEKGCQSSGMATITASSHGGITRGSRYVNGGTRRIATTDAVMNVQSNAPSTTVTTSVRQRTATIPQPTKAFDSVSGSNPLRSSPSIRPR
jgi:hypothetical protein